MPYDFIFAGAGPAGLAGAVRAAGKGRRCLLLDKKTSLALHPRGETLRHRPILDEILGPGVMDSIAIAATSTVEYYAPDPAAAEKIVLRTKTPNLTFEWREFMAAFERRLAALGVDFVLGAEVLGLIREADQVTGVAYRDAAGNRQTARARVIFAADGHDSFIGKKLGVDYRGQNFPIVKSLFSGAAFDGPAFRFFFLPVGSLAFAPRFPPAVAFLFPRDGANCEVGLMVDAGSAAQLGCPIPGPAELLEVFGRLTREHPALSAMLKEASRKVLEATMLPMAGPRENVIPAKGVVLLGDAAGFVEAFGGSGLVSSMESARFWVDALAERLGSPGGPWQGRAMEELHDAYVSFGGYRHLKRVAEFTGAAWSTLFVELRTSERIAQNWALIDSALRIS